MAKANERCRNRWRLVPALHLDGDGKNKVVVEAGFLDARTSPLTIRQLDTQKKQQLVHVDPKETLQGNPGNVCLGVGRPGPPILLILR